MVFYFDWPCLSFCSSGPISLGVLVGLGKCASLYDFFSVNLPCLLMKVFVGLHESS